MAVIPSMREKERQAYNGHTPVIYKISPSNFAGVTAVNLQIRKRFMGSSENLFKIYIFPKFNKRSLVNRHVLVLSGLIKYYLRCIHVEGDQIGKSYSHLPPSIKYVTR